MTRRAFRLTRTIIVVLALIVTGVYLTRDRTDTPRAAPSSSPTPSPSQPPTPTVSADPSDEPTTTHPSGVPRERCGATDAPKQVRFRVTVEPGIEMTEDAFAAALLETLCDEKGWIASGAVSFRYAPKGDTLIGLRTPDGAERRCLAMIGLSVNRYYSCADSGAKEAVINADRWFDGAEAYPGSLSSYRRMLVNHEVGHVLTMRHISCPAEGARAPVMMQQSKGMNLNGKTCRPNPWPLKSELERLRAAWT